MVSSFFYWGLPGHFQCFGLFDLQTGHKPVELLPGDWLYLVPAAGPPETPLDAAVKPLIQQAHAVRLPDEYLNPVTPLPAE